MVAFDRQTARCDGQPAAVEEIIHSRLGKAKFKPKMTTRIDLDFDYASAGDLSIWSMRSETGYMVDGVNEENALVVVGIRSGACSRFDHKGRILTSNSDVTVLPASAVRSSVIAPGTDFLATRINETAIRRRLRALSGNDKPVQSGSAREFSRDSSSGKALRFVLETMERAMLTDDALVHAPAALASLDDLLLNVFVELVIGADEAPKLFHPMENRAVRHAIDYIVAHLSKPLRVEEIAAASGISLRSLQTAFRSAMGLSLTQYIMAQRLHAVRSDLRNEGVAEPIKTVAYRWGFVHMSEFSRRYKLAFGETPLVTVRRRRF